MNRLRLIVLGNLAGEPFPGIAWQLVQYVVGLCRMGHEVYYFETSSSWPYDPLRRSRVNDSDYALPYLVRIASKFGFAGRWAYRRSYSDKAWFGLDRVHAEELLASADAVLSVTGSTRLAEEGLEVGRLVYICTDPVVHEVRYADGDEDVRTLVDEHQDVVTFGENIGTPRCPLPALPRLRGQTRQPILTDFWQTAAPPRDKFTTVGNWRQNGRDSKFAGEMYYWSKHREFIKFIDLPRRAHEHLELATGLDQLPPAEKTLLENNGWELTEAGALTVDSYRNYIQTSHGEFTVAKDANVRLRTGWFSDRSACYLAAGRPVITQDTGFGDLLPKGEGLFAFKTTDDIIEAFDSLASGYERHRHSAREIARQYFAADVVLGKLLADLGF